MVVKIQRRRTLIKYKKIEYVPEYPQTSEIMAELRQLETEINSAMDELEKMLKL